MESPKEEKKVPKEDEGTFLLMVEGSEQRVTDCC